MGDPDLRGLVSDHANKVRLDKVGDDFSSISANVTSSNTSDVGALVAVICRINYW